jgi:hypothetical protein
MNGNLGLVAVTVLNCTFDGTSLVKIQNVFLDPGQGDLWSPLAVSSPFLDRSSLQSTIWAKSVQRALTGVVAQFNMRLITELLANPEDVKDMGDDNAAKLSGRRVVGLHIVLCDSNLILRSPGSMVHVDTSSVTGMAWMFSLYSIIQLLPPIPVKVYPSYYTPKLSNVSSLLSFLDSDWGTGGLLMIVAHTTVDDALHGVPQVAVRFDGGFITAKRGRSLLIKGTPLMEPRYSLTILLAKTGLPLRCWSCSKLPVWFAPLSSQECIASFN